MIKPRIPLINWNNPITKKLVFDSPLFERGGTLTTDVSGKSVGTLTNGANWITGSPGAGVNFDGIDDIITYITGTAQNNLTLISIECLFLPRTLGESSGGRMMGKGVGLSNMWRLGITTNNIISYRTQSNIGANNWDTPTNSITLGSISHCIITVDLSAVSNAPTIYINGASVTVTHSTTSAGTLNADDTNLYIGNDSTTARTFDGHIYYGRLWNRLLNAQEVRQLYTNPWQIYVGASDASKLGGP